MKLKLLSQTYYDTFLYYLAMAAVRWLYSSVVERCTCNAAAPGSNPGGALLLWSVFIFPFLLLHGVCILRCYKQNLIMRFPRENVFRTKTDKLL